MAVSLVSRCFVVFLLALLARDSQGIDGELIAEAFVVVDAKLFDTYLFEENNNEPKAKDALLADLDFFFTDANEYYKSLEQYGLNIKVALLDVQILDGVLFSPPRGGSLDIDDSLNTFLKFLSTSEPLLSKGDYDVAIMMTGYDFKDARNGNIINDGTLQIVLFGDVGVAVEKEICSDESATVISAKGVFRDVTTIVHELGHLLGASHDAVGENYVMAVTNSLTRDLRMFTFSQKSANEISDNLQYSNRNGCLKEKRSNSRIPNVSPMEYKGRLQDANVICKRAEGPDSGVCTTPQFYDDQVPVAGDVVCWMTKCLVPSQEGVTCNGVYTTDGMPCEEGKSCRKGKCVTDSRAIAAKAKTNCLFGDDVRPFGDERTCQGYIDFFGPQDCPKVAVECCGTCGALETGDPDCPFGNAPEINDPNVGKGTCQDIEAAKGKDYVCLVYRKNCCEMC